MSMVIDDVDNIRSRKGSNADIATSLVRLNPGTVVSPSLVNGDNMRPDVNVRRPDLVRTLAEIDTKTKDMLRPRIDTSRGFNSIRLVPQQLSRDSNGMSARSYRAEDMGSRMPDKRRSPSERAYIMRTKFIKLNNANPKIEVPDSTDPDALERMYAEALRTHHYTKTSASWFLYIGIGYFLFQYIMEWFGLKLPANFVYYQLRVLSHYNDIIKQLGDPGGISIGSSWPAWVKLTVIIILQTLTFVIAFKITGSEDAAAKAQDFISSTGFMSGKKSDGDIEAETAAMDVGNLMSGFKGLLGGGEMGDIIGSVMNIFSGQKTDDIDLDDIPSPKGEEFSSRVPNMFSEE